jgi:hypothetical protein
MTMDEEERARIAREAHETIERLRHTKFGLHDPSDPIEQHRRNVQEPKPRDRGPDIDWNAKIGEAIGREREFLVEVVGAALAEALADQRRLFEVEIKTKMIDIKADLIGKMERSLERLIHALDDDKGKVIDLPNWPLSRREVN